MLVVRIVAPAALGAEVELPPGDELRIGRRDDCAIRILHQTVGRQAAAIVALDGGRAQLRDLGSTGGTWIHRADGDRERIDQGKGVVLVPGTRFFVGTVELLLIAREG